MNRTAILLLGIALAASLAFVIGSSSRTVSAGIPFSRETKGFVVMELFTSQGCSSCPPADDLLGTYVMKNDPHIIPLAFHVDYWNRLGWTDPFSDSKYTQRQHDYAEKFGGESVYTPQLIINGQNELVGSNEKPIEVFVNSFLKELPALMINITGKVTEGNTVKVDYAVNKYVQGSTINAALVQANIVTNIKAGENQGLKLNNYNVVRDFLSAPLSGNAGKITLSLPQRNASDAFSIVLFVQENASGKITGAVKAAL